MERITSTQERKRGSKSRKLIEEPKKKIVLRVTNKILREVNIDLGEPF